MQFTLKFNSLMLFSGIIFFIWFSGNIHAETNSSVFHIGLIGDYPYTDDKLVEQENLIADLNAHKELSFILHDGDFKGGSVPCDNKIYTDRLASFNQSVHPLYYVFGDNEWTDCHRAAAGSFNPFDRLALLRSLFAKYSEPLSFGKKKWALERQSEAFPENIRGIYNNVLFVGLHIPGSNNGLATDPKYLEQAKTEYTQRNAENLKWLRSSFELAIKQNSPGIMFVIQANPWDTIPAENLTGYEDFIVLLEQQTRLFKKPVVLVHGDSHYFRIDKPLPSALPSEVLKTPTHFVYPWESTKPRLANFTRVETFGNPNTHWVKATIDPNSPNVFSFEPMMVTKNIITTP